MIDSQSYLQYSVKKNSYYLSRVYNYEVTLISERVDEKSRIFYELVKGGVLKSYTTSRFCNDFEITNIQVVFDWDSSKVRVMFFLSEFDSKLIEELYLEVLKKVETEIEKYKEVQKHLEVFMNLNNGSKQTL